MSLNTVNQVGGSIVTALTATGTNQATALQLANRSGLQEITTVGSSTGVVLPAPKWAGTSITIANQGVNALAVYPQLGGSIDNGTANASVSLAAGKSATFEASSLTNWYTIATTASSGGSVSSVTFTGDGTVLSSTPSSAVTTSGTVAGTLVTHSANTVLAGPTTGSAAAPTFRAIVAADLPTTGLTVTQASLAIPTPADASTVNFDLSTGSIFVPAAMAGNRALTLSNAPASTPWVRPFTIVLTQDGSGSRTISSWFSGFTIRWAGGSAPTLTTTPNKSDAFTFVQIAATTLLGFVTGKNL